MVTAPLDLILSSVGLAAWLLNEPSRTLAVTKIIRIGKLINTIHSLS
jgi:hypothetical protein